MRELLTTTWQILSIITMKILRAFATAIVSFHMLPIHVAIVESKWIAGSDLGRKPGDDIDQDIDSFIRRAVHVHDPNTTAALVPRAGEPIPIS